MKVIFTFLMVVFFSTSALSQTKIMAFGESTTQAVPAYRKMFYDLAIADGYNIDMVGPNSDGTGLSYDGNNAGFFGYICSELISELNFFYAAYNPDIVLLLEGTNDCGWAYKDYYPLTTPDGIIRTPIIELSSLIDDICLKYPNALIFVSSVPPMLDNAYVYGTKGTPAGVARANAVLYNDSIPGMINTKIADGKKVCFVDVASILNDSDILNSNNDGVHPNQNGYNKMGGFFYNALKPFLSVITGTEMTNENKGIIVYPNPVTNHTLTIGLGNNVVARDISFTLYNMAGAKVFSQEVRFTSSTTSISLPQSLSAGLYFLTAKYEMFTVRVKIIIQ